MSLGFFHYIISSFVLLTMVFFTCSSKKAMLLSCSPGCWQQSQDTRANIRSFFLSLFLGFNSHFPGEPRLAGVYWSKGWRRWWWRLGYSSYKSCKAPVTPSPSTNQHAVSFTGRMPFLSPNQQCQSTYGKISHSMDLLTPNSPGVFQLCLWPLIAPGYLGGGLPCLSSALWCQYPNQYP